MIDIHSHILAGLDDGPETFDDSVAMARMAAETGTTDIVATPHSNLKFSFDPVEIDRKIEELQATVGEVIRIHRGCDFHLHYENVRDALLEPAKYAINRKCYLLVEFSELLVSKATEDILHRLHDAGLIPVITHPERHPLLQRRVEQLASWVQEGWCVQITAQSLFGGFGKQAKVFSEQLLSRRLVHFIASDAHDIRHRPPRLDLAFRFIVDSYGSELAERLCMTNPRAALEGKLLEPLPVATVVRKHKWFSFWR
jgi:protein-tyrosine phosphatase